MLSRRWFQFSLRTLLVFTLTFGIASGWIANRRRAIAERAADLGRAGAAICESQPQPIWRLWLFGDDSPRYARSIYVVNPIRDSVLLRLHLNELTQLRALDLADTHITDAGLAHLEGLTNLQTLILGDWVTDQRLSQLQKALPMTTIKRE